MMPTVNVLATIIFFVGGTIALFLACAWLYTFGFTDYRAHLQAWGLTASGVAFVVAFGLLAVARKHSRKIRGRKSN